SWGGRVPSRSCRRSRRTLTQRPVRRAGGRCCADRARRELLGVRLLHDGKSASCFSRFPFLPPPTFPLRGARQAGQRQRARRTGSAWELQAAGAFVVSSPLRGVPRRLLSVVARVRHEVADVAVLLSVERIDGTCCSA